MSFFIKVLNIRNRIGFVTGVNYVACDEFGLSGLYISDSYSCIHDR